MDRIVFVDDEKEYVHDYIDEKETKDKIKTETKDENEIENIYEEILKLTANDKLQNKNVNNPKNKFSKNKKIVKRETQIFSY
jgi:hypothetical protein